jgi:hypothetical protein
MISNGHAAFLFGIDGEESKTHGEARIHGGKSKVGNPES